MAEVLWATVGHLMVESCTWAVTQHNELLTVPPGALGGGGAGAVGSACPKAIEEWQGHPGTKSSGLSQRSLVAQWECLVL